MKPCRFNGSDDMAANFTFYLAALATRLYHVRVRVLDEFSDWPLTFGKDPGVRSCADHIENSVIWDPFGGLEALLHEVGHLACKHKGEGSMQIYSGNSADRAKVLANEREAWIWADREAQKLGLPFARTYGEWCYGHYTRLVPAKERTPIAWEDRA